MIMGQFKCSNDFIKYGKFLQKFQLVIRAGQIFRLYHQNFLIFEKISACDNRDSPNFQIASTNLPYFCENFRS